MNIQQDSCLNKKDTNYQLDKKTLVFACFLTCKEHQTER